MKENGKTCGSFWNRPQVLQFSLIALSIDTAKKKWKQNNNANDTHIVSLSPIWAHCCFFVPFVSFAFLARLSGDLVTEHVEEMIKILVVMFCY
jgi:hypothetical protein